MLQKINETILFIIIPQTENEDIKQIQYNCIKIAKFY